MNESGSKTYNIYGIEFKLPIEVAEKLRNEHPNQSDLPTVAAKLLADKVVFSDFTLDGIDYLPIQITLMLAHRIYEPNTRAQGLYRYTRNGSVRRQRDRIDGKSGISWCGKYPRTVQSEDDEIDGCRELIEETRKVFNQLRK